MKMLVKSAWQVLLLLMPWPIRRIGLRLLGYRIHPSARIGASVIHARKFTMLEKARVGHFNWIARLDELHLEREAVIGHLNWITGCQDSQFFDDPSRRSILRVGWKSAVLSRHHIDCTAAVTIGDWTNVAGWNTQILTHGYSPVDYRMKASPVSIGSRSLIGTRCVLLPGTILAEGSFVTPGSVVKGVFLKPAQVISGVPAKAVRTLPPDAKLLQMGLSGAAVDHDATATAFHVPEPTWTHPSVPPAVGELLATNEPTGRALSVGAEADG